MEALEIGLLHRAFVSQSKALLFFLPLLLLMMAFLHLETLMPTIWHAFTGFFEGPAFAFLLLNCLIVTIIASTKFEMEKGGHEEASKRESMRETEKVYEKGAFIGEKYIIRRGIIGKSHTYMTNYKQAADQCILGSNYVNDNQALAAAAAPTAADQCIEGSNYVNDNQALAAAAAPTAATDAPSPSGEAAPPAAACTLPAAAASLLRVAPQAPKSPQSSSDAPAAAIEEHEDADDNEHDSELEELNRRAEEFIARFNNQMRQQHQESLRRKGRPSCNHPHIQYSNHLQLPAPGLLVG